MEVQGMAYVLHKRAYQNTAAIVHLLTEQRGRVDVVARGALSRSARPRFNLHTFQPLNILCKGKTDLLNLYAAEASGQAVRLQGSKLFCGLYVNELLKELLPRHDAATEVFALYSACIHGLQQAEGEAELQAVLRSFELHLLNYLGYGIVFAEALSGQALDDEQHYRYQNEQGFVLASPLDSGSDSGLDSGSGSGLNSGGVFSGHALNSLSALQLDKPQTRQQAKQLLRQVLNAHLGGKALKSRELFL